MGGLEISLFGKFDVRYGQQLLAGLDAPKVQQLFCYLLLYRDRPHPREVLADLLWNGNRSDHPNRCLRKTLWQLRTALDFQTESLGGSVLSIEPEWVQVNPKSVVWLDVATFEQAFKQVQGMPGKALDLQGAQTLRSAVDLYRGGLQESWYQDWYLYERERYRHMYLVMLDKLMDCCEARRDYEDGLAFGSRILRCDRASERTHRRLMRLHYLAGDRTAALRQYEQCLRALDEELGVKPARATVRLYEQIRDDQFSGLAPRQVGAKPASEVVSSPLPKVLGRLQQLEVALIEVQRQVRQDIDVVELAIHRQR
jgi:DNA-binding SARP family transcriptional activator